VHAHALAVTHHPEDVGEIHKPPRYGLNVSITAQGEQPEHGVQQRHLQQYWHKSLQRMPDKNET